MKEWLDKLKKKFKKVEHIQNKKLMVNPTQQEAIDIILKSRGFVVIGLRQKEGLGLVDSTSFIDRHMIYYFMREYVKNKLEDISEGFRAKMDYFGNKEVVDKNYIG